MTSATIYLTNQMNNLSAVSKKRIAPPMRFVMPKGRGAKSYAYLWAPTLNLKVPSIGFKKPSGGKAKVGKKTRKTLKKY